MRLRIEVWVEREWRREFEQSVTVEGDLQTLLDAAMPMGKTVGRLVYGAVTAAIEATKQAVTGLAVAEARKE